MHRGRNRSRKPVESQTTASSQSQSASSSTVTGGDGAGGSSGGSFRTSPLPSLTASNSPQVSYLGRASSSRLQMDSTPYGIKYISGAKTEVGEHSFFSEASGSTRGLRMDSSVNNSWRLMPSSHDASSFPLMETRENSILDSTSSPLHHPMHINSLSLQQQQQYSFLGSGFSSANPVVKPENQPLRPFFDEWPRTKDSWSDIEDERSNRTSLSTTQLSISIPMVSSAFSTTSSRSPNDD
ncbi:growth-regulating factor 5-like [Ananas comosus]|nr:growth-regulating factor 5-like [Ananas comosus]